MDFFGALEEEEVDFFTGVADAVERELLGVVDRLDVLAELWLLFHEL